MRLLLDEPALHAIAERLLGLPSLPPEDEHAVLPVLPLAEAKPLEDYLLAKAQGTWAWLGGDGIVDELARTGSQPQLVHL